MMRPIRLFFSLLFFCSGAASQAQSLIQNDTTFVASASAKAVRSYHDFMKGLSGLYVGSKYHYPERTNRDHPFYREFDWAEGSVNYDGEGYGQVYLLYDLTLDEIVTEHFQNGEEIVLVKAKVRSFTIGADEFIHLQGTDVLSGLPSAGFYQLLYDGPSRLLARHTKAIEEKIEGSKVERYFTPKTKVFLLKDGAYHKVSGKGDLFSLMKDQKQAVRSFVSREKLRLKKGNALAFARVAEFYDSIKP